MTAINRSFAPAPPPAPGLIERFQRDGWIVLPGAVSDELIRAWHDAFLNLHERQIAIEPPNRGPNRWHGYLPFAAPFDEAMLWDHPQALAVLREILGRDVAASVIGSDTPRTGSVAQDVHQDLPDIPGQEALPIYCVALNIALVPFTEDNGPMELWPGTHRWPAVGIDRNALMADRPGLKPLLRPGDVLLRDARLWHRGTANRSSTPRPMLAVTYHAPWFRCDLIPPAIARDRFEELTEPQRHLLRLCRVG